MHERTTDTTGTAIPLPDQPDRSYTPRESERGRAMTSVEAGRLAEPARVSREPLARTERLLLTVLAGLFVMMAAMLSAGVLAFNSLSGHILSLQEQIGGLHGEIGGLHGEIGGLRGEIGGLRAEMHEEIGILRAEMGDLRAEMHEEIGSLRVEMGKLSDRMTRIETLLETHLVPASDTRDPAGP